MRVRQAKYDFRQLLGWYRAQVLPTVGGAAELTMTDIDERQNRIVIGVKDAASVETMRQRISGLQVPQDAMGVIQFEGAVVEALVEKTSLRTRRLDQSLSGFVRPLVGGLKIVHPYLDSLYQCTLGFNLVGWLNGNIGPDRFAVTNSHCAPPRSQVSGILEMGQPTGGANVALEIVDPGWLVNSPQLPDCYSGQICRFSDAALFRYYFPGNAAYGQVAYPSYGSTTFSRNITVIEIISPVVGWPAHMVGRISGHTNGSIVYSCANLVVYDENGPTNMKLLCQSLATYSSNLGDSGSPVIEPVGDGTTAYGLGVHWGKQGNTNYGLFSPLYAVLNELYEAMPSNGTLDPTAPPPPPPPPPLSITLTGPSSVRSGATCLWTATPTTGVAPYTYLWNLPNSSTTPGELIYQNSGSAFTITVTVNDAVGATGNQSKNVSISGSAPVCLY